MKKVVILVDQMHSHGGIEKLVSIKANYWTSVFGYSVTIVSTEQKNKPIIYPLNNLVQFKDLKINYNRSKSYFSLINLIKLLNNCIKIQWLLLKQKPDFILVASHIPITYVLPFLIKKKTQIIKEFHFTKYFHKQNSIFSKIINFIESKYDYLVVLSEEEKQFYKSKNTVVIPNPIEESSKFELQEYSNRSNIAIALVRFAPVKRLEKMISIWQKFIEINPDWKLHIFGSNDSDYATSIMELVDLKGLDKSIFFKGQTSNVLLELNHSKMLLLTSEQECFPMCILEAQKAGVVVISYDCPTGPRNILHQEQDGFLIPQDAEDDFINRMNYVVSNNESLQLISSNSTQNALNYSLTKVMNKWNSAIFVKS